MRELKRYKEELAVIGLLSLVLLAVRWVSSSIWPTTGQYDLAAETETVFWVALRLVLYTLVAWVGLRVVAPKAYNWLKHDIVDGFAGLNAEQKTSYSMRMYAILFFGLMMLAMTGCAVAASSTTVNDTRACVMGSAHDDVGVREATGKNDGPEVERYLAHVRLGKGYAWCAAFVCYHLSECGVSNPRSAWSPAVATAGTQVWTPRKASRSPLPGDVFSVYYPNLKRVGHVGFVTGVDGRYITTVEGNTSGPGSREGDGVYARKRELKKLHAITSYFPEPKSGPANGTTATHRSGAVRPGRLPHSEKHLAYRGATGQRGRVLDPQGYGGHRAQGQRGVACSPATRWTEHGTCSLHQRQRNGGALHPEWTCDGALHVRQPGAGAAALGALPTGEFLSPGQAHRGGRGNTNAQVGMVGFAHRTGPIAVEALAPAASPYQTPLT